MFLRLLHFEIGYHLQQTTFRIALIVYFFLGLMGSSANIGGAEVYANAPFTISFVFIVFSMSSPIVVALLTGSAILRDSDHRMAPLIFTTNITSFQYLSTRFVGLVVASFLAMLPLILGLVAGYLIPGRDAAEIGPFHVAPLVWSAFVILLPNILLSAAVIFCASALTRKASVTYMSALGVYILHSLISMIGESPLNSTTAPKNSVSSLLEPYGFSAFLNQTRHWTASEKNLEILTLEGPFLYNRLLWFGVALLLFNLTSWRFQFRTMETKLKPKEQVEPEPPRQATTYTPVETMFGTPAFQWQTYVSLTKRCFRQLAMGKISLTLAGLWVFLLVLTLNESLTGNDLGIPVYPTTAVLLASIYGQLTFFGPLVIIFLTGETLWQERTYAMDAMIDATPVSSTIFWASKSSALVGLILAYLLVTLGVAFLYQASLGQAPIQWQLYLMLAIKGGSTLCLLVVLCTAIMTLIPQKYGAMAACFAIITLFTPYLMPLTLGLNHPMLSFAYSPPWILSSMTGSSFHSGASLWYLVYWVGIAGLLTILTRLFWPRGFSREPRAWGADKSVVCLFSLALTLGAGAWIIYQTHGVGHYTSPKQEDKWRAALEWTYGSFRDMTLPTFRHVDLNVDLFPKQRTYQLKADMVLENHGQEPMRQVLLNLPRQIRDPKLELEAASLLREDNTFGQYLYRFHPPLQPGDRRVLTYSGKVIQPSFEPLNPENYILEQATYVELEQMLPRLGYAAHLEITDPVKRRKYGLPTLRDALPESLAPAEQHGRITFTIKASTQKEQHLIAPGKLVTTGIQGDRRVSQFSSENPAPMAFNLASAAYEQRSLALEGTEVTYYYHPQQAEHVDLILETAVATLRYGNEHFGPYGASNLTLASLPSFSYKFAGTACANTVYLVEDRAVLLHPGEDDLQVTARIVAHEVAHQWWGMKLNAAEVAGVTMLIETLAVYTEMMVMESLFGQAENTAYLDRTREQYFFVRHFERGIEAPLAEVTAQPSIYYFKGGHVVYSLQQILGEARLNHILRTMLAEYAYPKTVVPSHFIDRVLKASPEKYRELIFEMFREVATYDLKIEKAQAKRLAADRFQITCELEVQKMLLDGQDQTTAVPFAGLLPIALLRNGAIVAQQEVHLRPGQRTLVLETEQICDGLVLDPKGFFLELNRDDNRMAITLGD